MPQPPVTVRLDPRRLSQLKSIAQVEGISVADVITQIIRAKIEAGTIDQSIPGISVERVTSGIRVDMGQGNAVTYSLDAAGALARAIRSVVEGAPSQLNVDLRFGVVRQGTGIKIIAPFPGAEVAFPLTLAEDLAGLIEQALS
ncbi:hypothetical protein JHC09_09650 [Devosia sp. MC532]|uniref:hypothetical protein n=1 Tax=Devosia sp. MC532 TaxID=2799788 RepID=UPI0018F41D9A|nr:hypothetical protein [Devosia sp. MC532]MBJ7578151.1 hypothetical protein [Devosia sp. MC532]